MEASLDRDRVRAAKVIQDRYRSHLARPLVVELEASLDRDRVRAAKVIQDRYRSRLARPFVYEKGSDYPNAYYARQAPLSGFRTSRTGLRLRAGDRVGNAEPFQKVYGLPDGIERVVRFKPDREEHLDNTRVNWRKRFNFESDTGQPSHFNPHENWKDYKYGVIGIDDDMIQDAIDRRRRKLRDIEGGEILVRDQLFRELPPRGREHKRSRRTGQ